MDQKEKKRPSVGQQFNSESLDSSLRGKIPVQAGASSIFYTTRLCQRLVQSKSEFDLSDPNGYRLSSEYNSLHDPSLRRYLYRTDVHQRLTTGGFITKDDKVICSLREMNRYKQHLLDVERDWTRKLHTEKTNLLRRFCTIENHVENLSELTSLTRLVDDSRLKLPSIVEKGNGGQISGRHSKQVLTSKPVQLQRERRRVSQPAERRD